MGEVTSEWPSTSSCTYLWLEPHDLIDLYIFACRYIISIDTDSSRCMDDEGTLLESFENTLSVISDKGEIM
jgi:hypothetical protein